jgi:hypothetical protein
MISEIQRFAGTERSCFLTFIVLFLCASTVQGQWLEESVLMSGEDSVRTAYTNCKNIAARENYVHTVWSEKVDDKWRTSYRRSTDGGVEWEDVRHLSTPNSIWPRQDASITLFDSDVFVAWADSRSGTWQIYMARSTDNGASWSDAVCAASDTAFIGPSIVADGNTVIIAYTALEEFSRSIRCIRSTDGGVTWSPSQVISESYFAESPSLAISDGTVHVCWYDFSFGNSEIIYRRSTDGGQSWNDLHRLSDDPGVSNGCTIAASGDDVHVFWHDYRTGVFDVHYVYSWDGGLHWGMDEPIMVTPYNCYFPAVAVSGDNLHVAWVDCRADEGDIYYARSTNAGGSWEEEQAVTTSTARSRYPFVCVSGSVLHTLWMDDYRQIVYRRNPTGNMGTTATEDPVFLPEFTLDQNYPNPFSASSTLRFSLPIAAHVRITLHDMLGRKLQTMLDDMHNAGTYTTRIDGGRLSPGNYLLRMQAGEVVGSRIVTVLHR